MTKVTGQLFGKDALKEGYLTDSMGLAIDPNAIYNYEGQKYDGLTYLCRLGLRPRVRKELTRRS